MSRWHKIDKRRTNNSKGMPRREMYVWIRRRRGQVELACWGGCYFYRAKWHLGRQVLHDVTHWRELKKPEFKETRRAKP